MRRGKEIAQVGKSKLVCIYNCMKKLTHQEFLTSIPSDLNVVVLDEYQNVRTKLKAKCSICYHIWNVSPRNLQRGNGCPECGKKKAAAVKKHDISQDYFLGKVPKDLLNVIEVFGKYTHQKCEVEVKCKKCNRIWKSKPCYLYKGHGCNDCFRKRKGIESRKSHEQFIKDVKDFHGDAVSVVGKYLFGKARIEVKCNQCGYIWNPVASRLMRRGCPKCVFSKGEKKIKDILVASNLEFETEYVFDDLISPDGGKLRFDFAVIKNGVLSHLIEYDGKQHFEPIEYMGGKKRFEVQIRNDRIKNEFCVKNRIRLLRLPYTEYRKLNLEMLK